MANSDQPGQKALDFYNTYLSVIYGLLVTQGLTYVATFTKDEEQTWNILSICLFAGTFITSIRLWFVSASVDDLSQQFYGVVVRLKQRRFNFLLLLDTVFATASAGVLLAMFSAIPPQDNRFFVLFVVVAGLSSVYDLLSRLLVHRLTQGLKEESDREVVRRYTTKVRKWFVQDLTFMLAAAAVCLLDITANLRNSVAIGIAFVLVTVLELLVEISPIQVLIESFQFEKRER